MIDAAAPGPRYRRYTADRRREMLIEAGLACLAQGGIAAFTIDRICAEAGASRGLITHHFKSKDGLLAAVYAAMYDRMFDVALPPEGDGLGDLVEAVLDAELIDTGTLKAWLALWGEVANSPELQAAHRRYYTRYKNRVTAEIIRTAGGRTLAIDPDALAVMFISLVDGLWLERCIDPGRMTREKAREACLDMLGAFLGPLPPAAPAQ